ncbi:MAG: hypothetical protein M1282_11365 [Chloroflexi bacterium]|nr:hypothetical protein [Chloroflexota bacterium]
MKLLFATPFVPRTTAARLHLLQVQANTDKKDFKGFLTVLLSRIGVHPRLSVAIF